MPLNIYLPCTSRLGFGFCQSRCSCNRQTYATPTALVYSDPRWRLWVRVTQDASIKSCIRPSAICLFLQENYCFFCHQTRLAMHIVRILNFLGLLGIACLVAARSPQHVGKRFSKLRSEVVSRINPAAIAARSPAERRNKHRYLNDKTKSKSVGCYYATIRANNYQNSLLMENAFLM